MRSKLESLLGCGSIAQLEAALHDSVRFAEELRPERATLQDYAESLTAARPVPNETKRSEAPPALRQRPLLTPSIHAC